MNFRGMSTLVPGSSERLYDESLRGLSFCKVSGKLSNVKDELFSNSDELELREEKLIRRENLIRERELKWNKNSADYYDKRHSDSHVDIERPQ